MGRNLIRTELNSTPRQIYTRIPVFVGMIFEERIAEYGIESRAAVVCHLTQQYVQRSKGIRVSKAVGKVLDGAQREYSRIISCAPTMSLCFNIPGDLSVELSEAAVRDGFGNRHHLVNALVMAFCVAAPRYGRELAAELSSRTKKEISDVGYAYATYVSRIQHRILKERANLLGTSLSGLLRTAVQVLFDVEFSDGPCSVPENVSESMRRCMTVMGSTVKRFNRDIRVAVVIPAVDQAKVNGLMRKYGIQGAHEFTRRLVLFFLDGDLYEDTREEEPEEEENEYEIMERQAFAWEAWGKTG